MVERKSSYSEANSKDPNFLPRILASKSNITLKLNSLYGQRFVGQDFVAESRFSSVKAIVCNDENGVPNHDRLSYSWAPCVIVVPWGLDGDDVKVGILSQTQIIPVDPGTEKSEGVKFEQLVMGFLNVDADGNIEPVVNGAIREFSEESGTELTDQNFFSVIKGVFRPKVPKINYSTALFESWTDIVFLEVDPKMVGTLKIETDDEINNYEMLSLEQLEADIVSGVTDKGYFRDSASLGVLYIWRAHLDSLVKESKSKNLSAQG